MTRRVGLPELVPNDATPEIDDRRPDRIGRRRLQIAERELRARFEDCPRATSTSVLLDRHRLIDVVEPRRRARRVQGAGAARVLRGDVVEAVAHAELIARVHLMIDLREHVGRIDRIRIDAGRDRRAAIADRGEARVDRVDVRGGDRRQAGLIEIAAFDVREIERPIAQNRTAQARRRTATDPSAASCRTARCAR